MENAAKALLISATVLISMMVLAFMIYIFSIFRGVNLEIEDKQKTKEIQKFNSQFLQYSEPDVVLSVQDIITITNLANNNNQKYQLEDATDGAFYISVTIELKDKTVINNFEKKSMEEKINFIKSNEGTYKCTATKDNNTNRIKKIIIQQI